MKYTNSIFNMIKGIGIAFLFTIIAITMFSALLVYTNLSEEIIAPVIITISGISVLLGSSISTRKIKKKGMINGAIIGIIYFLIIYLISSALNSNFKMNFSAVIMILIGIFGGVLGGIIGINTRK